MGRKLQNTRLSEFVIPEKCYEKATGILPRLHRFTGETRVYQRWVAKGD